MTIDEINNRIVELEKDIKILEGCKAELIKNKIKDDDIIRAFDDAIMYIRCRSEQYKTTNWVMFNT